MLLADLLEEPLHHGAHRLDLAGLEARRAEHFVGGDGTERCVAIRFRGFRDEHFSRVRLERWEAPRAVVVGHQLLIVRAAWPMIRILRRHWVVVAPLATAVEEHIEAFIVLAMMMAAASTAMLAMQAMTMAAAAIAAPHGVVGNFAANFTAGPGGICQAQRGDQGGRHE